MLDRSLDRVFHALSDPTRRHMLERLAREPASVSALAAPFGMTLAAVVQHVQVLEECGVVRTEKVGRTRMCKLEPKSLSTAERWCRDRRELWEHRFDLLEKLLEAPAETPSSASTPTSSRKKSPKNRRPS
jgi:DNA-binding transcriptional ArsR family regulator